MSICDVINRGQYVGYSIFDQNSWMFWGGMCTGCSLCPSQLCRCAACATHITLSVAFAWSQYFARLSLLILLFYSRIVQSHCFSITSLHHSLMCVLFCSALLRLPSSSINLSGLPVPGALCVFSCACPSPSRSEHWGAHSDPSGGETTEDQSATQAGGGQRYGAGLNWVCPGVSCFYFCLLKLSFCDRDSNTGSGRVRRWEWRLINRVNLQQNVLFFFLVLNNFQALSELGCCALVTSPLLVSLLFPACVHCCGVVLSCVLSHLSALCMHVKVSFSPRPPCFSWSHFYEPAWAGPSQNKTPSGTKA